LHYHSSFIADATNRLRRNHERILPDYTKHYSQNHEVNYLIGRLSSKARKSRNRDRHIPKSTILTLIDASRWRKIAKYLEILQQILLICIFIWMLETFPKKIIRAFEELSVKTRILPMDNGEVFNQIAKDPCERR